MLISVVASGDPFDLVEANMSNTKNVLFLFGYCFTTYWLLLLFADYCNLIIVY